MTEVGLTFKAERDDGKGLSMLNLTVVLEDGAPLILYARNRAYLIKRCVNCYVNEEDEQEMVEAEFHDMEYVSYKKIFDDPLLLDNGTLRIDLRDEILQSTDYWDLGYVDPRKMSEDVSEPFWWVAGCLSHHSLSPSIHPQSYVVRYNSFFLNCKKLLLYGLILLRKKSDN